jgi:hypothetical protein
MHQAQAHAFSPHRCPLLLLLWVGAPTAAIAVGRTPAKGATVLAAVECQRSSLVFVCLAFPSSSLLDRSPSVAARPAPLKAHASDAHRRRSNEDNIQAHTG